MGRFGLCCKVALDLNGEASHRKSVLASLSPIEDGVQPKNLIKPEDA